MATLFLWHPSSEKYSSRLSVNVPAGSIRPDRELISSVDPFLR
jgi:hypothetical protein